MLDRFFRLSENKTTARTEVLAGLTTFLTMAYIIFLQPMVLSGRMFGVPPEAEFMDFGAVTTATCLAAALATVLMAVWARYPIALAPGMGENFFFVFSVLPAAGTLAAVKAGATEPWQVALGVVFIAGLLFVLLSVLGVQVKLLEAISPSMRNAIAVGIGLFIAFIGLQNASLVLKDPGTGVKLNPDFASPDLIVFFFGLLLTAGLHALHVRGSIVWGIFAATVLSLVLLYSTGQPSQAAQAGSAPGSAAQTVASASETESAAEGETAAAGPPSKLATDFRRAVDDLKEQGPVSLPPSMAPTFFRMDLKNALSLSMVPFILIFLFMDVFDTLGTLIGVSEQAGFIQDDKLPRMREALVSDAVGTAAGAAFGTSTVTSFIESAAGVEQGGRTGLTGLVVAVLFLLALFFSPLIEMIGNYPPITAPALVVVGSMMMRNVTKIDWSNYAESMPAFLILAGIPLTYSIGDGLALGFISYPIIKLLAGQGRDVKWLMYVIAAVLIAYLVFVRSQVG